MMRGVFLLEAVYHLLGLMTHPLTMTKGHNSLTVLADALGDVRGQIASLKAREAELRRAILEAGPEEEVTGGRYTIEVRQSTDRSFDPTFLPVHLRDNPRYWKVRHCQTVVTRLQSVRDAPAGFAEAQAPAPRKDDTQNP